MKTILHHNGFQAIINTKGAELISFKNPKKKEFIWSGDAAFWNRHAPNLFPIVGSLKDGKFEYKNAQYSLPRHGFARDLNFIKTHESENKAVFELHSTAETLKSYPFEFVFKISYKLENGNLSIGYSVLNLGKSKMYFGLGAHPAFQLNFPLNEYSLKFGNAAELHYNPLKNGLLLNEEKSISLVDGHLPLDYPLFVNDALVLRNNPYRIADLYHNQDKVLSVNFEDFPHLGLWTVENASFLCIEPWHSYTDMSDATGKLSEKLDIQHIEAEGVFNTNFSITLF